LPAQIRNGLAMLIDECTHCGYHISLCGMG
jgi:hypothetical protein